MACFQQFYWYWLAQAFDIILSNLLGNEVLLREKLLSIPDHMCNKHEFTNVEYEKCPHGSVEGERETRPWLDQDSLVNK